MTSNAGASRLGKKMMGFGERNLDEEVLKEAVKHTFQPEFRNRLSRIIYFRGIDEEMAERIAKKKLDELKEKLLKKEVELSRHNLLAHRLVLLLYVFLHIHSYQIGLKQFLILLQVLLQTLFFLLLLVPQIKSLPKVFTR